MRVMWMVWLVGIAVPAFHAAGVKGDEGEVCARIFVARYSGLENPSWTVGVQEAQKIVDYVTRLPDGAEDRGLERNWQKGHIITAVSDGCDMPTSIRVVETHIVVVARDGTTSWKLDEKQRLATHLDHETLRRRL